MVRGRATSQLGLHVNEILLSQLVQSLFVSWKDYSMHEFHRKWQNRAQQLCATSLKNNEFMTNADFAEKFQFEASADGFVACYLIHTNLMLFCLQYDHEVQSMYYITKSCTLFIVILCFPKAWMSPDEEGVTYETHAFWSNDKLQDAVFVDIAYRYVDVV